MSGNNSNQGYSHMQQSAAPRYSVTGQSPFNQDVDLAGVPSTPLVSSGRYPMTSGYTPAIPSTPAYHEVPSVSARPPVPSFPASAQKNTRNERPNQQPVKARKLFEPMHIMRTEAPFAETFCCAYEFAMELPELPNTRDPKFLNIETSSGLKRKFTEYHATTLLAEVGGLSMDKEVPGNTLELLEFDAADKGPLAARVMMPGDELLVSDTPLTKNPRVAPMKKTSTEVFLRKPVYITNDLYTTRDNFIIGHHSAEKRLLRSGNDEGSREEVIKKIEATFKDVETAAFKHPNPAITPNRVMPILPNLGLWHTDLLQVKFEEEPVPGGVRADDISSVMCRVASDAKDLPPNFAAYGYFTRSDEHPTGESIGIDGAECQYDFLRSYVWDNKGALSQMKDGSKFALKDRFMLLEMPDLDVYETKDGQGRVIQDSQYAVRFSFLSSRMSLGKSRAKALRADLLEATEDIGKLHVTVRQADAREQEKMARRIRPLVDPDCGVMESDGESSEDEIPVELRAPAPEEEGEAAAAEARDEEEDDLFGQDD